MLAAISLRMAGPIVPFSLLFPADPGPLQKAAVPEDRLFQCGGDRFAQLLNGMSASLNDRVAPYTCWYTGNSCS